MKFTKRHFEEKYPTEEVCLERIFKAQNHQNCPKCDKVAKFHRLSGRKAYVCQWCGHMVYPLAGTIFHKSRTPLRDWFYAIYLFSVSKNGVSANELERQLGVTYKCAWRMAKQIRILFANKGKLSGVVEADESFFGGKARNRHGHVKKEKTIVFGMVEKGGKVRTSVVKDVKGITLLEHIVENVELGSEIHTDEFKIYKWLRRHDYTHKTVNHKRKEYVRNGVHTNSIEGFWGLTKRSIRGTYNCVSPKYLDSYVNEFAWRYSNRKSQTPFFELLLGEALRTRQ